MPLIHKGRAITPAYYLYKEGAPGPSPALVKVYDSLDEIDAKDTPQLRGYNVTYYVVRENANGKVTGAWLLNRGMWCEVELESED